MVIDPVAVLENEERVTSVALDFEGKWGAFGDISETVRIINSEDGSLVNSFSTEGVPAHLVGLPQNRLLVGTNAADLHCHDNDGNILWSHKLGGGCDLLSTSKRGGLVACVDGGRKLHVLTTDGQLLYEWQAGEINRLAVDSEGEKVAVANDSGQLFIHSRGGQNLLTRTSEGKARERFLALTFLDDGHLVVSRESLDVIPGSGDEHELEWWSPEATLAHKCGIPSRCDVLAGDGATLYAGLFNGEVHRFDATWESTVIHKGQYAIQQVKSSQERILVGAWFHLHSYTLGEEEETWQIEHSGIIDMLACDSERKRLLVAGDDRSDYTQTHRIQLIDPALPPIHIEESASEMDDDLKEFVDTEGGSHRIIDASEYEQDGSDELKGILSDSELVAFEAGPSDGGDNDLLAMLENDDVGEMTLGGGDFDEDDIFAGLQDDELISNQPPVADAGEDQTVQSDSSGVATVMLDGSRSYDPDGQVEKYEWKNQDGKPLGTYPQVNVKLDKGTHTFYLTVTDDGGASTTDTTTITIL